MNQARQRAGTGPHRPTRATRVASLINKHDGTKIGSLRCDPSLSPGTLRLPVALLRFIFEAAVQDRLLASSSVTRLSMPRSERERIVPLSVVQVQALAQPMPTRSKAMVITQAGPWPADRRAAGAPSPRCRPPATNSGSNGSFGQTGSAAPPKHQDHDGCWRCRTWSPSSATARTEVRRETLADVAANEHRWIDHGYLVEDRSATRKAVS